MENKELISFINKNFSEDDEIEEILKNRDKLLNASDKSLEWLKFFFNDPEIENVYIQNERTKSIIVVQCLYYLNIFKNIYASRYRMDRIEKLENVDKVIFQLYVSLQS
jgi:hypothetical protein